MNTPNHETTKKVLQWLSFAQEDIKLATHALTLGTGTPYRLVAYHAQQCAETLTEAEELSPYAITARYPGEDEQVTKTEATRAIYIAQSVLSRIQKELKTLGMNLQE